MHSDRRAWLRALHLTDVEHFFELDALIVSGHPGRHVGRLVLGEGAEQRTVYLKREHGVRWLTRFLNFLSGFGWVSRPVREAQVLEASERDGLPGPRWLATGEDSRGRAFVMIEEVPGASSLMTALQARPAGPARRQLASRLGATLARLHEAGFFHRDLYAKHVLVSEPEGELCLLDWQRAWRGAWINHAGRIRDLACLHATLPDDLAGPRDRLACLRAYLGERGDRHALRLLLAEVEEMAFQLRQRRHIREKRQPPTVSQQAWISLDGEALSITPALAEMSAGQSLDWLSLDRQPLPNGQTRTQRWLMLPGGQRVQLVRQRERIRWWQRWWGRLVRRPILTPQQRQTTLLWRLERHGVTAPRVLAEGQRQHGAWVDSFLLCEPLDSALRLEAWLRGNLDREERAQLFYQAGALLAKIHEACCYFAPWGPRTVVVLLDRDNAPMGVGLEDGAGLLPRRRPCALRARSDLAAFRDYFTTSAGDPREWWPHFERGYASRAREAGAEARNGGLVEDPPLLPLAASRSLPLERFLPLAASRSLPLERFLPLAASRSLSLERCVTPLGSEREAASGEEPASGEEATCGEDHGATVSGQPPDLKYTSLWKRLTRGWRRLQERPDWEHFAGPGWADRIMQIGVTDDFHAKQGRSTGRWVIEAPRDAGRLVVYLKRHYRLPFWTGWLATIWPRGDWSPAMQEYRHLEWAREQGVPVPATVAAGEFVGPWGKLSSFLVVEELTDMLPLHQAIPRAAERLEPAVFRRWKRGLVAEMARLSRLLHDRRHFHKDLYLCHFFIEQTDTERLPESWRGRMVLIDLHRLTHHPWTWWQWQLKDLAQLLYSSDVKGVDVRDQLAFWKHYLGPGAQKGRLALAAPAGGPEMATVSLA